MNYGSYLISKMALSPVMLEPGFLAFTIEIFILHNVPEICGVLLFTQTFYGILQEKWLLCLGVYLTECLLMPSPHCLLLLLGSFLALRLTLSTVICFPCPAVF